MRYYEKSYEYATVAGTATANNSILSDGSYGSPTTLFLSCSFNYMAEKRANPTVVFYDTAGNSGKCNREWLGVGSSQNQNATAWTYNSTKRVSVLSGSGDNRTHALFHFTATAEL